ncbi:MAG: hypothetical protein EU550_03730 [Promethearchaeota archaeon]|nr:MAG: hypothetical protein EU550_03730 [Candidatus Lokiarchaeota archaeon]
MIYLSSLKNINPFIEAAKIAQTKKIPLILNPGMLIIDQGFDSIKNLLEKVDIFILSNREYKSLMNIKNETFSQDKYVKHSEVLKRLGIQIIIITLGKRGALLICKNKSKLIPLSKQKKVVDTTGAGDAFSAGFIFGLSQYKNFKFETQVKAVKLGNYVAGECIQHLGARNGIPLENEINSFFNQVKNNKI